MRTLIFSVVSVVFLIAIIISILISPYFFLSHAAEKKFDDDFEYVFATWNDDPESADPIFYCSKSVFDLNYNYFVFHAINMYAKITRPSFMPMHAAIVSGKDVYIWSFNSMNYEKVTSRFASIIYRSFENCRDL